MTRWQLVIPVKPADRGKSRLGAGPAVARALALDTIAAARSARIDRLVVVTADGELAALADGPGVEIVLEDAPRGIAAAIASGLAVLDAAEARAVLLGDLPALRPEHLDAALARAAHRDRAFVRDADGSGTTLVTARGGVDILARFGPDSASAHAAAGLVELPIPATSTLRRDVDDALDLRQARRLGVGAATRAALDHVERAS